MMRYLIIILLIALETWKQFRILFDEAIADITCPLVLEFIEKWTASFKCLQNYSKEFPNCLLKWIKCFFILNSPWAIWLSMSLILFGPTRIAFGKKSITGPIKIFIERLQIHNAFSFFFLVIRQIHNAKLLIIHLYDAWTSPF